MKNKSKNKQRKRWRQAQQHSQEFMDWFRERIVSDQVPDHIKWLSFGPCTVGRRYVGYFINGYKFYTQEHDANCKTQNSGVTLTALTSSFASTKDHNPILDSVTYYGRIQEIIELDYWNSFKVIIFRCEWFHVEKDTYGLTRVNFNKLCYADDPFILASQGQQVFYIEDPIEEGCCYVMKKLPKEFFNFEKQTADTYFAESNRSSEDMVVDVFEDEDLADGDATRWCREGVSHTVLELYNDPPPVENHDIRADSDDTDLEFMNP